MIVTLVEQSLPAVRSYEKWHERQHTEIEYAAAAASIIAFNKLIRALFKKKISGVKSGNILEVHLAGYMSDVLTIL